MFEELFKRPHTIKRYRAAPLVEPRERYFRHLAEAGACRRTLRLMACDQVRLIQGLGPREGETVTMAQIEAVAPEWDGTRHHKFGQRPWTSPRSTKCALGRATRWLRFLGWLGRPEEDPHPYSAVLGAFEDWMRAERGHAERSIDHTLRSAKAFLDRFATNGFKPLESVRLTDVDAAIAARTAKDRLTAGQRSEGMPRNCGCLCASPRPAAGARRAWPRGSFLRGAILTRKRGTR